MVFYHPALLNDFSEPMKKYGKLLESRLNFSNLKFKSRFHNRQFLYSNVEVVLFQTDKRFFHDYLAY